MKKVLNGLRWKCIAFDAVGTLIYPDPGVAWAYFQVAQKHGSKLSLEEIRGRFSAAFKRSEYHDVQGQPATQPAGLTTSEARERERWRQIVADVIDDVSDNEACFKELYSHFADPRSWKCFPDVAEVLQVLHVAGCRLVLASNFDHRLHGVCDGLAGMELVQSRVISSAIGFRKPSRQFFETLLMITECRPDELLMVGDDLANDILGPRELGISSILIDRQQAGASEAISSLTELPNLVLAR